MVTRAELEAKEAEFYGKYLQPFHCKIIERNHNAEIIAEDERWFADHPDRSILLRLAYSGEFTPDFHALVYGAFDGDPIGVGTDVLMMLDKEPKRIVAVQKLAPKKHLRGVVWLGPADLGSFGRDWTNLALAIRCQSDDEALRRVCAYEALNCGDESYCVAWLAKFFTALSKDPVMHARWTWQSGVICSKVN